MTTRIETNLKTQTGDRPANREDGELYINFPDKQLGVSFSNVAEDLIPIRFFSSTCDYFQGEYVVENGVLYSAPADVPAGAFDATKWNAVGSGRAIPVLADGYLTADANSGALSWAGPVVIGAVTPGATPPPPPPPADGATVGWAGGPEPQMTPGQIGTWFDITALTGFTGTWPLVLASQETLPVPMSDGSTVNIVIEAKSYPDAEATDGGNAAATNGLGWQLFYDGLPAGIEGTMPVEDGGNLYLRVDALVGANPYPIPTALPPATADTVALPTNPYEGMLFFDPTSNATSVYTNGNWIDLSGSSSSLSLSGGTLTGPLYLSGPFTDPREAASVGFVEAQNTQQDVLAAELHSRIANLERAMGATPTDTHVPAGTVLPYAGDNPPASYLICDGSAVSRITYDTLFAAIGETYGAGDGTGTFNLPDMRGQVPAGAGGNHALASKVGEEAHRLTVNEMPAHTHGGSTNSKGNHNHSGSTNRTGGHTHNYVSPKNTPAGVSPPTHNQGANALIRATSSAGDHSHSLTVNYNGNHTHSLSINNSGGGQAHSSMQPTLFLNYIIRT